MTLIFFQNIISPHQIPYIRECVKDSRVDSVYLIVPQTDLNERMNMGWDSSKLIDISGIQLLVAPKLSEIKDLYSHHPMAICVYSGIHAYSDVFHWFKTGLNHNGLRRWIITEPPFLWKHTMWQHRLRYYLQDFRYHKAIEGYFCFGELGVDYYTSIYSGWKVYPFQYVTEWVNRSLTVPDSCKLKILYTGSLSARKNVRCLLEACKQLPKEYQEKIEIGLIGDGEKKLELELLAKDLYTPVTFYGTKSMSEIPDIMQQYDILVLPSLHDGWGAVVNEALTLGLYVICSDACGAKYLLKEKQQGVVFGSDNAYDLMKRLLECIDNKDKIRSSVEVRINWAKNNISGPAAAEYFLNCLTNE